MVNKKMMYMCMWTKVQVIKYHVHVHVHVICFNTVVRINLVHKILC